MLLVACANPTNKIGEPSWYLSPQENDSQNLYGVSYGATLEEATRSALADAAARLMVTISSESSSLLEEDSRGVNSEMRQKIRQNIEKIDFTNFKVARSKKFGPQLFVEVKIKRAPFIRDQREKITFAEKKVSNLAKGLNKANPIQKRVSLLKILEIEKQIELSSRILAGSGEDINLTKKLDRIAHFQDQFNKLTSKIEFYFEINSSKKISQIIRTTLNKEKIAIAKSRGGKNQIIIKIKSSSRSNKIYGAYMTKLQVDFENIYSGKTVASNVIEVTGSSTIGKKESYLSAIQSLEEKISKEGILKVIGVIN